MYKIVFYFNNISNHMHFLRNGYKCFSNTNSTDPRQRVPLSFADLQIKTRYLEDTSEGIPKEKHWESTTLRTTRQKLILLAVPSSRTFEFTSPLQVLFMVFD